MLRSMERSGAGTERAEPRDRALAFEAHVARFRAVFGASQEAVRAFFAPGRVNLMGAHLDYNGGPVMPMAIDRGTFVALRPRSDRRVRMASTLEEGTLDVDLDALPRARAGRWSDYPLGVLRILRAREGIERSSGETAGVDLLFGGNLPVGAGLSSSASICVGTALALDRAWGLGLGARERVDVALRAEREFVGVRCGIMDPFAVGLAQPGKLLWLDCKDVTHEHLPLDHDTVLVAVADSGVRRELAQGAFNQRVAEAAAAFEHLRAHVQGATVLRDVPLDVLEQHERYLPPPLARRARHVVEEVARTFDARRSLIAGDVAGFGSRMLASHRSLRDLYEVSAPELDELVDAAASTAGVLGARLTGAGFGGCVVLLLRRGSETTALDPIARRFEQRFGRRPPVQLFGGDAGPREIPV
jgi:galactokinase